MNEMNKKYCPLISIGMDILEQCIEKSCAWWVEDIKKCAILVLANHNLKEKRQVKREVIQ